MFTSSSHIRKLFSENREGITDEEREKIHNQHRLVFFIIGMSVYPNSDTSLLTQKLFHCENFANDCMLYHNVCLTVLSLTFTILLETSDFKILVLTTWFALLCHISHILIALLGKGYHARNLFITVFAVMGLLRAVLVFSCPLIISKLFYITAFVLLNNSRSGSALILGFFQGILNKAIGFNTYFQARLNLILCHTFQALITLTGAIWITLLYLRYHDKVHTPDDHYFHIAFNANKVKEKFEKFNLVRYYYSRFALYHLGSVKYFFHPGLIPYLLELPIPAKLNGSIIYTFCEFLGRNSALGLDETIYTKPGNPFDSLMFAIMDIPLFLLIFAVIFLNSIILYSTLSGRFIISRSAVYVYVSVGISGLVYGYIITRATTGSKAIVDYYKKKGHATEITNASKNVSEVLTMSYYCTLIIPYTFSRIVQSLLRKSRLSRDYILSRNYGNLSSQDVINLLIQFKKG